eukprot:scaffold26981_cov80-Skeletonema_marinoi.AAC.1
MTVKHAYHADPATKAILRRNWASRALTLFPMVLLNTNSLVYISTVEINVQWKTDDVEAAFTN